MHCLERFHSSWMPRDEVSGSLMSYLHDFSCVLWQYSRKSSQWSECQFAYGVTPEGSPIFFRRIRGHSSSCCFGKKQKFFTNSVGLGLVPVSLLLGVPEKKTFCQINISIFYVHFCVPVSSQLSRECQFLPLLSHWVSCGFGELYQMERAGVWNPGFIPSVGTVWTTQVHSFPATALLKFPTADWKGTSEGWVYHLHSVVWY